MLSGHAFPTRGRAHTGLLLAAVALAAPIALMTPTVAEDPDRAQATERGAASLRNGDAEVELVALGRALFFDAGLSADGQVSCATCHQPERAFADGKGVAEGVYGRRGTRNTPSLINAGAQKTLFWDGRRTSLEAQVRDPFVSAAEHGLADQTALLRLLRENPDYVQRFAAVFGLNGEPLTGDKLASALAAYVRSLESQGSPFDRYRGGDQAALSERAKHGLRLFRGSAGCAKCHAFDDPGALFTDHEFHSVGVGLDPYRPQLASIVRNIAGAPQAGVEPRISEDKSLSELGRFLVTRNPADIGKFKTPSLRNVVVTAPYMHDGSIATLEEVIDHELYYRSLSENRAVFLSPEEKLDLIEFLRALTDASFVAATERHGR